MTFPWIRPCLHVKSAFLRVTSPFVRVKSLFSVIKSLFLRVKSSFLPVKSPFLRVKSLCLRVKSQFLRVISQFLHFLRVKSQCLVIKSLFVRVKSTMFAASPCPAYHRLDAQATRSSFSTSSSGSPVSCAWCWKNLTHPLGKEPSTDQVFFEVPRDLG